MTEILRGSSSSSSTPGTAASAPPPRPQSQTSNENTTNSGQLPPIAVSEDSDVVDGEEEDSKDDISAIIEYMRQRETYQLDELKQELENNKQMLGTTER